LESNSLSKPKNKKITEINELSDLTMSLKRDKKCIALIDIHKSKAKADIMHIPKPVVIISNLQDTAVQGKSRNAKADAFLKTTSMGGGQPQRASSGTKKSRNEYRTDKSGTFDKFRNTMGSFGSKSREKGMHNINSKEKDIELLSSNYLLLKQKVNQLKTNLENRKYIGKVIFKVSRIETEAD
jgi:hypothetical protein